MHAPGLTVRYRGWSSVELALGGGSRVIVDPNYTPFDGECLATPADFEGADLMLVTHGHFDHCQDAPAIMRSGRMHAITSPPLKRLIETRSGASPDRVHAALDGERIELGAVRVETQGWVHRGLMDRWPKLLARRPAGLLRMRAALRGFITSPLLGFHLETGASPPVTVIGEAFHGDTDLARVERLKSRWDPGVAVIALEPGLEESTARATALLGAHAVVAYSAHEVMWKYFGLPEIDGDRFREEIARTAPSVDVRILRPGEHACFP